MPGKPGGRCAVDRPRRRAPWGNGTMARRVRNRSQRAALFVAVAFALATGCHHHKGTIAGVPDTPPIGLPPAGSVPTELNMQNLPEYVIEPPDTLLINAVIRVPANEAPKKD